MAERNASATTFGTSVETGHKHQHTDTLGATDETTPKRTRRHRDAHNSDTEAHGNKRRRPDHSLSYSVSKRSKRSSEPTSAHERNARKEREGSYQQDLEPSEDPMKAQSGNDLSVEKDHVLAVGDDGITSYLASGAEEVDEAGQSLEDSAHLRPELQGGIRVYLGHQSARLNETISGDIAKAPRRRPDSQVSPERQFGEEPQQLRSAVASDSGPHGKTSPRSGTLPRLKTRGSQDVDAKVEWFDSGQWLKKQVLPILQILSYQILASLADIPQIGSRKAFDPTRSLTSRKAWYGIQSLFNKSKSLLNDSGPFLDESGEVEVEDDSYIYRLVNITTALCLIFVPEREYEDIRELHSRFSSIFCHGDAELEEWQIALLVDVKRELWTIGIREDKFSQAEGLQNIFSNNTVDPHAKQIRDQYSQIIPSLQEGLDGLSIGELGFNSRYAMQLRQTAREILQADQAKTKLNPYWNIERQEFAPSIEKRRMTETVMLVDSPTHLDVNVVLPELGKYPGDKRHFEREKQRSSATNAASHDDKHLESGDEMAPDPAPVDASNEASQDAELFANSNSYEADNETVSSTQEQYEKAKLAASAKSAAKNKGVILQPSQRRPWSPEEESALMTGLDKVQGPHWSQILAMYGPGGSVSEILKDRNQVQLKDKARNLKLFFLKSGHEVPHYLKNVTGELKTRAPYQGFKTSREDSYEASARADGAMGQRTPTMHSKTLYETEICTSKQLPQHHDSEINSRDQADNEREHRKEDEEDLSNAIQLALQAIQEKSGAPQPEEDEDGRDKGGASKRRINDGALTVET